jgi:hypothetical protein
MLDEQALLTTEIIAMRSEFVARRQRRLEEFTAFLEERALEGPFAANISNDGGSLLWQRFMLV